MRVIVYEIAFVTSPYLHGLAMVIGLLRANYSFTPQEILGTFSTGYLIGLFVSRLAFKKELPLLFKRVSRG